MGLTNWIFLAIRYASRKHEKFIILYEIYKREYIPYRRHKRLVNMLPKHETEFKKRAVIIAKSRYASVAGGCAITTPAGQLHLAVNTSS